MRRKAPSADSCAFSTAMRRAALSVMTTARSLPTSDIASDMYCTLHLARVTATVYLGTLGTLSKRVRQEGADHAAGTARRPCAGARDGGGGEACPAAGDRAQGVVALDLDDPQRQSPPAEPRRAQGRRPSGLERLGRDPDDRALSRRHAAAGPGRGQAARRPG